MSASVRQKLAAAADYLEVAPTVVGVVRDLDLGSFDSRIRPLDAGQEETLQKLASEDPSFTVSTDFADRVVKAYASRG